MNKISLSFFDPQTKVDFESLPISRQTITSSSELGNYKYYYNNMNADWQIVGTWIDNIEDIKGKIQSSFSRNYLQITLKNNSMIFHSRKIANKT